MSDFTETIEQRFKHLMTLGPTFTQIVGMRTGNTSIFVTDPIGAQSFLSGAANLIAVVTGRRGVHYEQAQRVLADERLHKGVPIYCVRTMAGVLDAAYTDYQGGLLTDVRYADFAITFDDFLDHAANFHRGGKIMESSILASAVLEDVMRRIAEKHQVTDPNMEQRIDSLVKLDVFSATYAKRVKSWAAVRTSAFHARWEELDLPTVGAAIAGIRELIDNHLA